MATEKPSETRPRNVDEAREILSREFNVPPDKLAGYFEIDEATFAVAVEIALAESSIMGEPFLYEWAKILGRTTDLRHAEGKTDYAVDRVRESL